MQTYKSLACSINILYSFKMYFILLLLHVVLPGAYAAICPDGAYQGSGVKLRASGRCRCQGDLGNNNLWGGGSCEAWISENPTACTFDSYNAYGCIGECKQATRACNLDRGDTEMPLLSCTRAMEYFGLTPALTGAINQVDTVDMPRGCVVTGLGTGLEFASSVEIISRIHSQATVYFNTNIDAWTTRCSSDNVCICKGPTCEYCPAGKYSIGAETCKSCPAGTYSGSGFSECIDCAVGKHSDAGSWHCSSCAPGMSSGSGSVCTACAAGKFSGTGGSCKDCAAGQAQVAGQISCDSCLAGKYSMPAASSCTSCAAGKYSMSAASSCTSCAAGKDSSVGSASCDSCPAGKYSTGDTSPCTSCATGKFSLNEGSSSCELCPAGRVIDDSGYFLKTSGKCDAYITTPEECQAAVTSLDVIVSSFNHYSASGTPSRCHISSGDGIGAGGQLDFNTHENDHDCGYDGYNCICKRATYEIKTSGTCDAYITTLDECEQARTALGLSDTANSVSQGTRSSGCIWSATYSNTMFNTNTDSIAACGLPSAFSCICKTIPCSSCAAGMYGVGGTSCELCPVGKLSIEGSTSCDFCPAGKEARGPYELKDSDTCDTHVTKTEECEAAITALGLSATSVQVGEFASKPRGCSAAGKNSGSSTSQIGEEVILNTNAYYLDCGTDNFLCICKRTATCESCVAGKYQKSDQTSPCKNCPAGYWSDANAEACTSCVVGKYQNTPGSIGCKDCPTGWVQNVVGQPGCKDCAAGTYVQFTGQTGCYNCPRGWYQHQRQQSHCTQCPKGWAVAAERSTSCSACASGSFSQVGYASCHDCATGYYSSDSTGNTNWDQCRTCGSGRYQSDDVGPWCTDCEAGKYNNAYAMGSCTPCVVGKYQETPKSIGCKDCPKGWRQNAVGETGCKECAAGQYQQFNGQTGCYNCPAGFFTSDIAQYNCEQCAVGRYQSAGLRTSCTDCPRGFYGLGMSCTQCPNGWASWDVATPRTSCAQCVPGRYSNVATPTQLAGKEQYCTLCEQGKYNNQNAQSSCKECLPGYHASGGGQGICVGCEVGKYAPGFMTSHCQVCPKGEYQDETTKTSCDQCPSGYTTNGYNQQTSCSACAKGRYSGDVVTRQNGCNLCYTGAYNDETGQTWCKSCPSGFDQEETGKSECETAFNTHSSKVNIVYAGRRLKQFVYTATAEHDAVFTSSISDTIVERTPVSNTLYSPNNLCQHTVESKYRLVTGTCADHGFMDVRSCTADIKVPNTYIDPSLLNSGDCSYGTGRICENIPAGCGASGHACVCKLDSQTDVFNSSRDCSVCGGGVSVTITSAFQKDNKCVCSDHVGSCDIESGGWVQLAEREVSYSRLGNGLCDVMTEMNLESIGVQERLSECATSCEKPQYDGFGITDDSCACTELGCSSRTRTHYETFIYNTRLETDVNELVDVFDIGSTNLKCYKDVTHEKGVSCDWIRALKHFARGTSYRAGDCSHMVAGTDTATQVPCSGHGFSSSGTCACDYAEEFDIRGSGVGLTFEAPNLRQTPFRGRACQKICPGYDMKSMDSVCSGHGLCTADGRCDCEQGWAGSACSLACELDAGPLTCSGHGTCDQRTQVHRLDIVKQLNSTSECPSEKIYLSTDRVVLIGTLVYHMVHELSGGQVYIFDLATSLYTKRPVTIEDYYVEGTAHRVPYGTDFVYSTGEDGVRKRVPFMPCTDTIQIVREQYLNTLFPVTRSDVTIGCDLKYGDDPSGYTIFCGSCTCEESSRTGNWTGYDCRTPSLGHYGEDARRQCPGMTADNTPCRGGGTCNWGSVNGDGDETFTDAQCFCGDVTDAATYATAPRNVDGDMLFHVTNFGVPLYQDSVEYVPLQGGVLTETNKKCWYPVQYGTSSKEDCRDYCTANFPASCITMDGDQCYCCTSECSLEKENHYKTITSGLCTSSTVAHALGYKNYAFVEPGDCEAAAEALGFNYGEEVVSPGAHSIFLYHDAPCYANEESLRKNTYWDNPIGSYSTIVECKQNDACVCVEVATVVGGVTYDVTCQDGLTFPTQPVCENLGGTFDATCIKDALPVCVPEKSQLNNYNTQDCSCRYGWTGRMCDKERMMCLFSGEESYEGDKCTCNTPDGFPNMKVTDQGCCPVGSYFQQKRYSSFSPLLDFKVFDNNAFYTEALLQTCQPSLTSVAFQTDSERILAIQNYLASTDEYHLTEEVDCVSPYSTSLYHSVERYFSLSDAETSITFKREGSVDTVRACSHHCIKQIRSGSPNRGFTLSGFSSHTVSIIHSGKYCSKESKSVIPFAGDGIHKNPGTTPEARVDFCNEACTGTSKLVDSNSDSQNTKFWEQFSPSSVTHFIVDAEDTGGCTCFATATPGADGTCEDGVASTGDGFVSYAIMRLDAECACETAPAYFNPIVQSTDSKRFDLVYPYSDDLGCFKDETGQVFKHADAFGNVGLLERTGIPKTLTMVRKTITAENKLDGAFDMWGCYERCIGLKSHALQHTNTTCTCTDLDDATTKIETNYVAINAADTNTGEHMVKTLAKNYVISQVDGDTQEDAAENCFKVCEACPSFGVGNESGVWDCYCNEFTVHVYTTNGDPTIVSPMDSLIVQNWAIGCAGETNGEMTQWLALDEYSDATSALDSAKAEIARITSRYVDIDQDIYDLIHRCHRTFRSTPPLPGPDYDAEGYCVCTCSITPGEDSSVECDQCVADHGCSLSAYGRGKDRFNSFCKGKVYGQNIKYSYVQTLQTEQEAILRENTTLTDSLPALEAYVEAMKTRWQDLAGGSSGGSGGSGGYSGGMTNSDSIVISSVGPNLALTTEYNDGSLEEQWRPGQMYLTSKTVFELNTLPYKDTTIRVTNAEDTLINPLVCNIESYLNYGDIPGPTCTCPIWEYHRMYETEGYERFGSGFCLPDTNKQNSRSLQMCKDLCTSDADCNAFSWISTNQCILAENGCDDDGEWNTDENVWNRYKWTVLESSKNKCCKTGERVVYTVPFSDPSANLHSCLQECTESGDATARVDKTNQFECVCGDTEYTEAACPAFEQECGGPQYSVRSAATSPTEQCACTGSYMSKGTMRSCPSGKYMPKDSACAPACITCPFGRFSDTGASECRECGAGKIQDTPFSCEDCSVGKYAISGDSTCTQCVAGKFSLVGSGACTLCPDGWVQASVGQGTCGRCGSGEYAPAGSTACSQCTPGKYTGGYGMGSCKGCVAGKYSTQASQSSETSCSDCPDGYISSSSESTSCSGCSPGSSTTNSLSFVFSLNTKCYACIPGLYQNQATKASCKQCVPGKYGRTSGLTACSSCEKGFYTQNRKSTFCFACNHGTYASQSGRSDCTDCGELYSGYQWVSHPQPHVSWDETCDQIKPCPSGFTNGLPKCYDTQFTGSSKAGYGDNYRKCCWDYKEDSCSWHASRYSGENNAKWTTRTQNTGNSLIKWCDPANRGY